MFEDLKEQLSKIRERDIAHKDLGEINDFSRSQEFKTKTVDFLLKMIEHLNTSGFDSEPFFDSVSQNYPKIIQSYEAQCQNIDDVVSQGIYNPQFPVDRQNYNQWFEQSYKSNRATYGQLALAFDIFQIGRQTKADEIERELDAITHKKADLSKAMEEADRLIGKLRDASSREAVNTTLSTFSSIVTEHRDLARNWLIGLGVSLLPVIFGVVLLLFPAFAKWLAGSDTPVPVGISTFDQLFFFYLQKFSLIFLPLFATRICLTKYNTERHLVTIYKHRIAALTQYKTFEDSIHDDDRDAKNSLRLGVAKDLLSDPRTGYTKEPNEVGIPSQVVNLVERIVKP